MAYENFIPAVWNTAINRELERNCVLMEDCNRQYEGEVKDKGDSVKILGVGKPTIKVQENSDRNNDIDGPEMIESTAIHLPIKNIAYFNYMVGDIDKRQAVGGVMEALSQETSEGLANVVDKFIASLALSQEAVKAFSTPTIVTEDNVLKTIDTVIQKLYENDVKESTKITLTVPPRFYFILKRAYTKLDTDNSALLKNGRVGMYGKVIVKLSNNIATSSNGAVDNIMMRTDRAVAFVKPMTHSEPYRPEKKFADAIKGFILYDGKVVRPKEMFNMNVKYA